MSDLPDVPLMTHPDITSPVYEILHRAGQGAEVNALAWRCVYAAVAAAARVLAPGTPPETPTTRVLDKRTTT